MKATDAEKENIIAELDKANGNHSQAAKALGFHRTTLTRKIRKYNIRLKAYTKGKA